MIPAAAASIRNFSISSGVTSSYDIGPKPKRAYCFAVNLNTPAKSSNDGHTVAEASVRQRLKMETGPEPAPAYLHPGPAPSPESAMLRLGKRSREEGAKTLY
jgi:hypothetical protein